VAYRRGNLCHERAGERQSPAVPQRRHCGCGKVQAASPPLPILNRSKGREFAGQGAFAAVGDVAVDGAAFDSAIELGAEFAGFCSGDSLVLGREGGVRFARKGFERAEGAAVAHGADFRLAGTFGGGFDVGHKLDFFALVPEGRIELPTKGL
jgi:hypothetical protein